MGESIFIQHSNFATKIMLSLSEIYSWNNMSVYFKSLWYFNFLK